MPPDDQSARFALTHTSLPGFENYPYWIPAEDEVAPDTSGDASDPWATFSDAPPLQAPTNGSDRLAIFSGNQPALANTDDPWAAFPDWPPTQGLATAIGAGDPWSAFPNWLPAQVQLGGDINPFAGLPNTPWSFPTSPAPGHTPWSVNGLPPTGTLFSAPSSFGAALPPQAASDPWAAFPDRPPAGTQQQSPAAGPAGTPGAANFYTPVGNNALNPLDLPTSYGTARAAGGNLSGTIAPYGPLQTGLNALGYAFQHSADPELTDAENLRYLVENYPQAAAISGGIGLATALGIPLAFALPEFLAAGAAPAKTNVWAIPPTARGRTIETALGAHLPPNFPVIDAFQPATGAATSIKSIDLGAATYQNAAMLYGRLSGYVNKLAEFSGSYFSGTDIPGNAITSRTLIIAVPNAGTAVQQQVMRQIIQLGIQRGVAVKVVPFP